MVIAKHAKSDLMNSCDKNWQGVAPTIAVDNTNGCQLYLSKESLAASITTAKSSEINVLVPGATDDSDPVGYTALNFKDLWFEF